MKFRMKAPQALLYSVPHCHWCHKVKDVLRDGKVAFREVNVLKSARARHDLMILSGQRGVPVLVIEEKVIVGFDERALEKIVRTRGKGYKHLLGKGCW